MFFLQTNGSGVLSFAGVSVAGTIVSSAIATDTTNRATTSTSFVTGSNTLSVTITPSSASNKILIIANIGQLNSDNGILTIYRGATNLGGGSYGGLVYYVGSTISWSASMSYLDSPATTSATTYQVYFKSDGGGNTTMYNGSNKSTIIVMEIKG